MKYRITKRVSLWAGAVWLCLVAFVAIVRVVNLPLGTVQPEAIALTFMMTLPFTLGATALAIAFTWLVERRSRGMRSHGT